MTGSAFAGNARFEILQRLGAGGMGVVYRARDRERQQEVALKAVRARSAESILRFKNEFHALHDLAHPNLVTLGELFVEDGQWFFTMELIAGVDFLSWVRPGGAAQPAIDATPSDGASGVGLALRRTTPLERSGHPLALAPSPSPSPRPRPTGALDEPRLRAALVQLARGLNALHEGGKVHRDVKPTNILVAPDGRVVLLDFGLATDVTHAGDLTELEVFGTTAYMAPEQAAAQPVGPESDWYAVGALLYEALTGRLPFEGAPLEILMAKQRGEPPPASTLAPVPADLDELCASLLRFARARRPSGADVLRRLETRAPLRAVATHTQAAPFVGRGPELALLGEAFAEMRRGRAVSVCVEGESGVGKSALVRRFTEAAADETAGTVVLRGRCYQRESVPYKAFDGVVDELSRTMRRLPKAEAAALLPRRASLLLQVFPVLGRVEVLAEAPRARDESLDPVELRARVFAALRELLTRLGERRPLVIVVDDLQWADAESLGLIDELMRPPDAPPLLLLTTVRPGAPAPGRRIALDRLPPDEARQLARLLLERTAGQARAPTVEAIAAEAAGHPLFIDALVRHTLGRPAAAPGGEPRAEVSLDEALRARVAELAAPARRVLELVAVAGTPLGEDVVAEAVPMDRTEVDRAVAVLRVAHLVRTDTSHGTATLEPYHDRVREAVAGALDADTRRAHHRRLALALSAGGRSDAETLAVHQRESGDLAGAARSTETAADEAAHALAFARAARLYRTTLELASHDAAAGRALRTRLGDALAAAGRGHEAAAAYLAAAADAPVADALDLRRRAAEQLLVSGHIDEGLRVLDEVLRQVGMHLPATPRRALASLAWLRTRVALRGLGFRERDASQLAPETLTRIDICWSVAAGLAIVDTIRGAAFQTRNLLLSLDAGEPYRVARALALEAGYHASDGRDSRRTRSLFAQAGALAARTGPHARGLTAMCAGVGAFSCGRWRESKRLGDEAEALLVEHTQGVAWELDTARLVSLWSQLYLGEVAALCRRGLQMLRDARERGNHYMATNLRTRVVKLALLCADRPADAEQEVTDATAGWTDGGFHFQHFNSLAMQAQLAFYAGNGARALARIDERWPALERSLLLRVRQVRIEMLHLRGAAAVAAVRTDPKNAARLQRRARADAHALLRDGLPWAHALGLTLRAALEHQVGDPAARATLADAVARLEAAEMALHAACARRHLGTLTADATLVAAADTWLRTEEVVAPARLAAMFIPGFDGA